MGEVAVRLQLKFFSSLSSISSRPREHGPVVAEVLKPVPSIRAEQVSRSTLERITLSLFVRPNLECVMATVEQIHLNSARVHLDSMANSYVFLDT